MKKILLPLIGILALIFGVRCAEIIAQPIFLEHAEQQFSALFPGEIRYFKMHLKLEAVPKLQITDLVVLDPQTQEPRFKIPQMTAQASPSFYWSGRFLFKKITLENPEISLSLGSEAPLRKADPRTLFRLPQGMKPLEIEAFGAKLSFSSGLPGDRAGRNLVHTHFLLRDAGPEGIAELDAFGTLDGGEDFKMTGAYSSAANRAQIKGDLINGSISFGGAVIDPLERPVFEGDLRILSQDAQIFQNFLGAEGPSFAEGPLMFNGQGRIPLFPEVSGPENIILEGGADIRRGFFNKNNWLLEILKRAEKNFDEAGLRNDELLRAYQHLFSAERLPFELLQFSVNAAAGEMIFEEVIAKGSDYIIEGAGTFNFKREEVDIRGRFVVLESLSGVLIGLNPGLANYANPHKRLVFPFVYRGLSSQPVFRLEETGSAGSPPKN
ncbi:MAG: hypothetical protein FGM27_02555 [Candidatus Omnitrophica bacterium]|nr:hypothetical protein [Candidatus Omnitrophota bacterium]